MAPAAASASPRMSRPHVVLVSFEGKGHINPFMMLAKEMAKMGLSITIIFPSSAAISLVNKSHNDPTEGLDIQFISIPEDADEQDNKLDMLVTMPGIRTPLQRMSPMPSHPQDKFKKVLEELVASPSPPVAIVFDLLLRWAFAAADELHIPRFVFYTAAASHLAISLHLSDLDLAKVEADGSVDVPGLPTLRWCDIPPEARFEADDFFFGKEGAMQMLSSQGILMNTSEALEGKVINELRKRYTDTTFVPIGPLCSKNKGVLQSDLESKCKEWLDSKKSVVYISFGSWAGLGERQILELAGGIEASNVEFLWVLPHTKRRTQTQDEEDPQSYLDRVLPEGFQSRTANRGLIVTGWAPQQLVLSHPSLCAFVTHCGWNSVTECIVLAGVPMIGWPFLADQPAICTFLVEELKVAVGIAADGEGIAVKGEVERALRCVTTNQGLRRRASELRQRVLLDAATSFSNLEDIVYCIKKSHGPP